MITLSNGYTFTFCCASGALGFTGDGYWWEQPLRWLRILRPAEFTIIAKTVTYEPRRGNLSWWCPWRCVRFIPGGAVNAVGLSNMGIRRWIEECYPVAMRRGYNLIASIQPTTTLEATAMGRALQPLNLKAVEINLSCPNSQDRYDPVKIVKTVHAVCGHPLIAKLNNHNLDLIPALEESVEAFDLINAVPWDRFYPGRPSPLARYALLGGVSGTAIRHTAQDALMRAVKMTSRPIISGGGIDNISEVRVREALGASAFSLGTVFLRAPWRPNRIVEQYERRDQILTKTAPADAPCKELG